MTSDPSPSSPSKGSGEAVWGRFWPALAFWSLCALAFAFLSAAFWSAVAAFAFLSAAFWSAVVLLAAAFWSADPGVVLAGGFCAVVELEAAAL